MKRLLLIAAAAAAVFLSAPALADVTFGASVTNANGNLSTRLTWSTNPVATTCQASGHPSWTGAKAPSGSLDLPPITQSGTYDLTLSCTRVGDTQAVFRHTRPLTNTDGTALAPCAAGATSGTCLVGYRFYRANNAQITSPQMVEVRDPATLTYTWTGLSAGAHYFASEAINANGVPSPLSNPWTKTITATAVENSSVRLTVNPVPSAPNPTSGS